MLCSDLARLYIESNLKLRTLYHYNSLQPSLGKETEEDLNSIKLLAARKSNDDKREL
jgi:hypothetical protein